MAYTWVEHTGEVELAIEAPTQQEVFADALHALSELIVTESGGARRTRQVYVEASDPAALLAAFLDELVFLAERDGFVAKGLSSIRAGDTKLEATVSGRMGSPRQLVKAVTYHRLRFERGDNRFVANVVLDV